MCKLIITCGNLLKELDRLDEAEASYRKALDLNQTMLQPITT